eukprot:TRINITY_DN57682_c0_g1_i1.p1 TRINITY_DN57682_c0_g1~~TRINITY_DN57682_c0_g1_i1.p1  ORF type:complete len:332 (+),score=48.45 TRINITY_DN57682_c0_g1_i1:156-1151(+)
MMMAGVAAVAASRRGRSASASSSVSAARPRRPRRRARSRRRDAPSERRSQSRRRSRSSRRCSSFVRLRRSRSRRLSDPSRSVQETVQRRSNLLLHRTVQRSVAESLAGGDARPGGFSAVAATAASAAAAAADPVNGAVLGGSSSTPSVSGDAERRVQRPGHLTNFELERLFLTSTSPAVAAALRHGGAPAAAAAAQLRQTVARRRQGGSESYLRSWDPDDRQDVVTVPDPAEPLQHKLSRARRAQLAEAALARLPRQILETAVNDACAICQQCMEVGETVRRLPCAHLFHGDCLERWLRVKLTCPLDGSSVDAVLDDGSAPWGSQRDAGRC